jgi:hypothetical protein
MMEVEFEGWEVGAGMEGEIQQGGLKERRMAAEPADYQGVKKM